MQHKLTLKTLKAWYFLMAVLMFISLKSQAQKDFWTLQQSTGASITARSGAVEFTIGNKAYIGTGSTNSGVTKDFWEFDATTGTWSQKADFGGSAREYAAAFSIGTKGYVGTGLSAGGFTTQRDFWEYDPSLNVWVQKADYGNIPRFGAVGFSIKGKGYIATGYDWSVIKNDCYEYDPSTDKWTFKTLAIPARFNAACFTINDKAYIGTGAIAFRPEGGYSRDFWEYDPANNKSTQIADFPGNEVVMAAAFSLGGRGYVGTGLPLGAGFFQYDPILNRWSPKANFPGNNRNAAIGFSIGNNGYLGLGKMGGPLNDIWKYQIEFPDSLKALYVGRNFVHLDWKNSNSTSGATFYDVFVDGIKKYSTAESAITADGLLPNTIYTFTVAGRDATGMFLFQAM